MSVSIDIFKKLLALIGTLSEINDLRSNEQHHFQYVIQLQKGPHDCYSFWLTNIKCCILDIKEIIGKSYEVKRVDHCEWNQKDFKMQSNSIFLIIIICFIDIALF